MYEWLHPFGPDDTSLRILGSSCLNVSSFPAGDLEPKNVDVASLRLSATPPPAGECPVTDGAPPLDALTDPSAYDGALWDEDGDGREDLTVRFDTAATGGDASSEVLYLTGRFADPTGPLGDACFQASLRVAPYTPECDQDGDGVCDDL